LSLYITPAAGPINHAALTPTHWLTGEATIWSSILAAEILAGVCVSEYSNQLLAANK